MKTSPRKLPWEASLPRRDYSALLGIFEPILAALLRGGFFSLDFEGQKRIPKSDNLIFAPNHAGWFTLDTFIAGVVLRKIIGDARLPYGLGFDVLFKLPLMKKIFSLKNGFIPVSWVKRPDKIPRDINLAIFPEGVDGNVSLFGKPIKCPNGIPASSGSRLSARPRSYR